MSDIGRCACDNREPHEVCELPERDEKYLDAPLYSPSKAQLKAEEGV